MTVVLIATLNTTLSVALAGFFVLAAGFNVWNMLSERAKPPRNVNAWLLAHRAAGYVFIVIYVFLSCSMLLRLKGLPDELSPRLVLHAGLALLLAPLLLAKVLVARYQKSSRTLLSALGVAIFVVTFVLVALNVSVLYLRSAPIDAPPAWLPLLVLTVALALASLGFFTAKTRKARKAEAASAFPAPLPFASGDLAAVVPLTLARIDSQTHDAKTFRFTFPTERRFAAARPGQFLTFEWEIDGERVTRCYSICSSPNQRSHVEITVKRVANGRVSQFLNDRAAPGFTVNARGPYGSFVLDELRHKRVVMIAGGSGITPMISMLRHVEELCLPLEITLIYCVRSHDDIFFRNFLHQLASRVPGFHFVPVFSRPTAEFLGWHGHLRREILGREIASPRESTFFLCGPPPLMELSRNLLAEIGVPPENIIQESFGSGAVSNSIPLNAADGVTVTFARTGTSCSVSPRQTLLEGSEKVGVVLPSGCRQGICGTCATRLIHGEVQRGDEQALDEELRSKGFVLLCVTKATSDVTLDA